MRVTTLINNLIGLQGLWVRGFHYQADKAKAVLDVVPRRRRPRCGVCGGKVRKNKSTAARRRLPNLREASLGVRAIQFPNPVSAVLRMTNPNGV